MIDPVITYMHMGVLVTLRSMNNIMKRKGVIDKFQLSEYIESYLEILNNEYDIEFYDELESILK
jgi:hypothetical protein